ncbi:transposase [Bythopirellula goksoeyrii]|uniref:Transposase IS200 like protein n=1 Tax=Bythopirellula goksoeyrii TaxID=1400387 RepID=A0A5B9Q2T4_9BACT|nr:transposase [Bythopirellula goksoeyrii]QEG33337.1 Transposase IS200 like protein [Bythopirellula goksoeyrii]
MATPLAYFLTWTTYGTWLHGTGKGMGSVDAKHNEYGTPFVEPDSGRLQKEQTAMSQPAWLMDPPRRKVVRDAIIGICSEKGWNLRALHVRTNHVHVVVQADREPGRLMSDLKARASRELNRAGLDEPTRKRWTRHGSTLHLFDAKTVEEKIRYTIDGQGTMMEWYKAPPSQEKEPRTK